MANVFDVAEYILLKKGEMTTIKLQKLVYYSQAWCLVWTEKPLFPEEIQAWANGPVVPVLYNKHKGEFKVDSSFDFGGDVNNLTDDEKDTIDHVLDYYGNAKAWQLADLTYREDPWKNARGDIPISHKSKNIISNSSMIEYYKS